MISRKDRELVNGHHGLVLWFIGLSGSGKSTLAAALERELFIRSRQVFVLDGDHIRCGLSSDLGFSPSERSEHIRRTAHVARLFAEAGLIVIVALISPYARDRDRVRCIINGSGINFIEAYVSTPLSVCEERDPKGLYRRARSGEILEFTGVSAQFETPGRPDITIDTSVIGISEATSALLDRIDLNLQA